MLIGRVDGFIHVVPGGGITDVSVAGGLGLGEDGEEARRGFESGGRSIEAVEVGKIGLVAGRSGECPIFEEEACRMGGEAGSTESPWVPGARAASVGRWVTSDGAKIVEARVEGMVREGVCANGAAVDRNVPTSSAILAKFVDGSSVGGGCRRAPLFKVL